MLVLITQRIEAGAILVQTDFLILLANQVTVSSLNTSLQAVVKWSQT